MLRYQKALRILSVRQRYNFWMLLNYFFSLCSLRSIPKAWAECLLKITDVLHVCTVIGNQPSEKLGKELWGDFGGYIFVILFVIL